MTGYLKLQGQKTKFKGSSTAKGREGHILVSLLQYGTHRDAAVTGVSPRRKQNLVIVTKQVDSCSPLLYGAFVNDELMTTCDFQVWSPAPVGAEQQILAVRLKKARIVSIATRLPGRIDADPSNLVASEDVGFSFETIQCKWIQLQFQTDDAWVIDIA